MCTRYLGAKKSERKIFSGRSKKLANINNARTSASDFAKNFLKTSNQNVGIVVTFILKTQIEKLIQKLL